MQFKHVNEQASATRVATGSPYFSFAYRNKFYGSCTLVGRVIQSPSRNLTLDAASVRIEEWDSERGTAAALESSARIYLQRILREFRTLEEFEQAAAGRTTALSGSGFGFFLRMLRRKLGEGPEVLKS